MHIIPVAPFSWLEPVTAFRGTLLLAVTALLPALDARPVWAFVREMELVQGDAGYGSLLALDAAGYARMSYYDETNDDLKYAWRDGTGWHTGTVDADGWVGTFSSLALDADGTPRISNKYTSLRDLKFVRAMNLLVVPGGAGTPTDIDAGGPFEDVNGNGRKDFEDVVLYFNQMAWIEASEPLSAFDYNANGRIDFADVTWLFHHL